MNQATSENTIAPQTTRERWEAALKNAREELVSAKSVGEPIDGAMFIRMRVACNLESAHEIALNEAERLAEVAQRLIRNLKEDGAGASFGGNAFESQARQVAESLQALTLRREAFQMASAVVELQRARAITP